MCGRFVQLDTTISRLEAIKDFQVMLDTYPPHRHRLESYNISPQRYVAVIRVQGNKPALDEMLWGIEPGFTKGKPLLIINARIEGIEQKKTFRNLLNQKILIPMEGFYEWKKAVSPNSGNRAKTPFYFHRKDRTPMLLAGIFQTKVDKETAELTNSFAILTTRASSMMAEYHERMPVLVEPHQVINWLLCETTPTMLEEVSHPAGDSILAADQVSTKVNSTRNDGATLIEPIDPRQQQGLFQ